MRTWLAALALTVVSAPTLAQTALTVGTVVVYQTPWGEDPAVVMQIRDGRALLSHDGNFRWTSDTLAANAKARVVSMDASAMTSYVFEPIAGADNRAVVLLRHGFLSRATNGLETYITTTSGRIFTLNNAYSDGEPSKKILISADRQPLYAIEHHNEVARITQNGQMQIPLNVTVADVTLNAQEIEQRAAKSEALMRAYRETEGAKAIDREESVVRFLKAVRGAKK